MQGIQLPDVAWWISLFVLIGISVIYIIQNYRIRREMIQARKTSSEPYVKPILQNVGPVAVKLVLKNVGLGPALDLDIKITSKPVEGERHWTHRVLAPGDFTSFFPPHTIMEMEKLVENFELMRFEGTYKTLYGDVRNISEEINFKEVIKSWTDADVIWEESSEEILENIRKELDAIKNTLSSIKASLDRFSR